MMVCKQLTRTSLCDRLARIAAFLLHVHKNNWVVLAIDFFVTA